MADVNGIAKIEMFDDSRDIGCVVIHIVPVAHLGRTAMTAAIMRDDAITLANEEEHLRIPVVGTKWPAVMKDDRLGGLRAPILVEDLDAIFGRNGSHGGRSFQGSTSYVVWFSRRSARYRPLLLMEAAIDDDAKT
jgi:hypothetical protein